MRGARAALADSRALEEQNLRTQMRGAGRFIGAGGVPSMGLSQFVGGGYDSSDDDCGCKKCMGGRMCGGKVRLGPVRGAPPGYSATILPDVPTNAIIPYRPTTRPGPRGPSQAIVPLGPSGRPLAKPALPQSYYQQLFNQKTSGRPTASARGPAKPLSKSALTARAGALMAAGLSLAAITAILAQEAAAGSFGSSGNAGEDAGYYDDYVEPDADGDGIPDSQDPDFGPSGDVYGPGGVFDGPGMPSGPMPSGPMPSGPVSGLSQSEVRFYLQSGNLPDRFYAGPRSRRGAGKKPATGRRAERAAIVRKVMADKGMKLIEASRYVKANNLY